jgi:hypothetical protein
VCTALDRIREGEVLKAVLRGPPSEFHKYKVQWYRSKAPVTAYENCARPVVSTKCCPRPLLGCGVCAAMMAVDETGRTRVRRSSMLTLDDGEGSTIPYVAVRPRPLSHLPLTPPDHERSPTLEEVRACVVVAGVCLVERQRRNVWFQVRAHVGPILPEPEGGYMEYPLFASDVHHMIRCGVVLRPEVWSRLPRFSFSARVPRCTLTLFPQYAAADPSAASGGKKTAILSLAVGPVEPAPPSVRGRDCVALLICNWFVLRLWDPESRPGKCGLKACLL